MVENVIHMHHSALCYSNYAS